MTSFSCARAAHLTVSFTLALFTACSSRQPGAAISEGKPWSAIDDSGKVPDAPTSDAVTAQPGAQDAGPPVCMRSGECNLSGFDRHVRSEADCYCPGCGSPVSLLDKRDFEQEYSFICAGTWYQEHHCKTPVCPERPVGCVAGQCSLIDYPPSDCTAREQDLCGFGGTCRTVYGAKAAFYCTDPFRWDLHHREPLGCLATSVRCEDTTTLIPDTKSSIGFVTVTSSWAADPATQMIYAFESTCIPKGWTRVDPPKCPAASDAGAW